MCIWSYFCIKNVCYPRHPMHAGKGAGKGQLLALIELVLGLLLHGLEFVLGLLLHGLEFVLGLLLHWCYFCIVLLWSPPSWPQAFGDWKVSWFSKGSIQIDLQNKNAPSIVAKHKSSWLPRTGYPIKAPPATGPAPGAMFLGLVGKLSRLKFAGEDLVKWIGVTDAFLFLRLSTVPPHKAPPGSYVDSHLFEVNLESKKLQFVLWNSGLNSWDLMIRNSEICILARLVSASLGLLLQFINVFDDAKLWNSCG